LKLKYDVLLSSFAFKFNLRRYSECCARAFCEEHMPADCAMIGRETLNPEP
jgi:hypothetical protein